MSDGVVFPVVRTVGDAMVASYFAEGSDKARKKALEELGPKLLAWMQTGAQAAELEGMVKDLREGEKPVPVFHWEVEFPDVFSRENGGVDCFVGNPPFLGGTKISIALGSSRPTRNRAESPGQGHRKAPGWPGRRACRREQEIASQGRAVEPGRARRSGARSHEPPVIFRCAAALHMLLTASP